MGPPRRKHNRTEKVKRAGRLQFSFASFFTLIYVAGPLESRWRSEERTYAHSILKGEARARGGCPWAGRAFLALNNRSRSAAERHGGRRKRAAICDEALLPRQMRPGRGSSQHHKKQTI